jgi:hypothetical protein
MASATACAAPRHVDSRRRTKYAGFDMQKGLLAALLLTIPLCAAPGIYDDPAVQRLNPREVSRTRHEVSYDELARAMGGPFSRQPVISVKAHPEIVWVRPDMALQMVANPFSFATGDAPAQIPWRLVERSLERGYLPIVQSAWRDGGVVYRQQAFTSLLDARAVKTGHEKQIVMVKMDVVNTEVRERRKATLWVFVPGIARAKGDLIRKGDHYGLFEVVEPLPAAIGAAPEASDDVWRDGERVLGVWEADSGVKVTRYQNALKLEMELWPGATAGVRVKVSSNKNGFTPAEIERLRKMDFAAAHDRRVAELEATLDAGMQIDVPESVVNNIYKAQILYNQTAMVQAADRDYYMPVQGYQGVWAWEAAQMLMPMAALGYYRDAAKSFGYFIQTQGLRKPDGEVISKEGSFNSNGAFERSGWEDDKDSTIYGMLSGGRRKPGSFPYWVNSTGSVLWAMAEHYFYSKDREWMKRAAGPMVEAANWIVRERAATKVKDARGEKVLHYGLMPAGKPYDVEERVDPKPSYAYAFTDGWTWLGLQRTAEALSDAGHPDGARLLKEAAAYRADILEVMRRKRQTDPALPPYPERVYGRDEWASFTTSGVTLLHTGLLAAGDPAFPQLEDYTQKHFAVLGLTGKMVAKEMQFHGIESIYTVISDDAFHQAWIERGEIEKALLAFYSVLACGVDRETMGTIERFSPEDRRYTPFFMNGSASGRILMMIRKTLLMERDGKLNLLAGAPRRWLEDGKRIDVANAPAYFGSLSMSVRSEVDQGRIRVRLDLTRSRSDRLRAITLRVPHPSRQPMREVQVNGKRWTRFDAKRETVELPAGADRSDIVVSY